MSTRKSDKELWEQFHRNPTPDTFRPIVELVQPDIEKQVRVWSTAAVPSSMISDDLRRITFVRAKTWDPNHPSGASLRTHINNGFQQVGAVAGRHQNVGRIPDHRRSKIGAFKQMESILREELGRDPDDVTLANRLGWSLNEVARMRSEDRKDLITSKNEYTDPLDTSASEEMQKLRYVYYNMDARGRTVMEHTFGMNGKPVLSAGKIAKKLGVAAPTVSKIKAQIRKEFEEWDL